MVEDGAYRKVVLVTGDVTVDWHIRISQPSAYAGGGWDPAARTKTSWQWGGAALLARLVEAIADSPGAEATVHFAAGGEGVPRAATLSLDARLNHSYSIWSQVGPRRGQSWRLERFLGLDPAHTDATGENGELQRTANDATSAELVVIDDAALGFRDRPGLWPQALAAGDSHPWVLLKMAQPVAEGLLWQHLLDYHASRLFVVTTATDLRHTEVQISQGLSWERTAQDVVWEMVHNPRVSGLGRCAGVVVTFGAAGAVVVSNVGPKSGGDLVAAAPRRHLIFDPPYTEGAWEDRIEGGIVGGTTCVAASLARELMSARDCVDLVRATGAGISAVRALYTLGYVEDPETSRLGFPISAVVGQLERPEDPFAVADVQDPVRFLRDGHDGSVHATQGGWWTIVDDRHRDDLVHVAMRVVQEGPQSALSDVPQGRFGHLFTVDRREIEGFRSIHSLVSEYLDQDRPKRPLSIGVFGAPGSGKSFGITQVAHSLAPGRIEVIEFNLSQFEVADEIADALHLVRDTNLSGKIPLVFWDEFDAPLGGQQLGWLRHFLSPMQDGSFRQGQVVHPIGRAIFVFAGGTSHRMSDFGRNVEAEGARAAKLPDFVSRLKGYVDVLGPNPVSRTSSGEIESDPYFVIRRAILLRSILARNASQLLSISGATAGVAIDVGVLKAFLKVREYKHGVRSMESIVAMSRLAGRKAYERSSLPSEAQLDLHVDGQEFLALVQELNLEGELLERLAEAAHEVLRARTLPEPYAQLAEPYKDQNRSFARDIPNKLARIGYVMIAARSNEPPFEFPPGERSVELLARLEHERWMNAKIEAGWRAGAQTDRSRRVHACITSWENLPAEEREKDELLVKAIPQILARVGYTVARLRREMSLP